MNASRPDHEPALPDEPGQARVTFPPTVADHELLRCIGRGSYGEVWLGRNVLGEYRAVKIVYRRAFDQDRPFNREFEGIKKFEPISRSHPSQLNILHVGRSDAEGYFYYVMELADDSSAEGGLQSAESTLTRPAATLSDPMGEGRGEDIPHSALRTPHSYTPRTLRQEVKQRGHLPVDECVKIGHSLAGALAHLHAQGLVHRDVKPSNIIFVRGVPKLADIGLVAAVSEARSFVGTEGFIPPEGPGTPQADLYSLGKVLYEISTGKDRRDFPALPDDLAEDDGLLELNAVILKACKTEPRDRYPSVEGLLNDLESLQHGKSVRQRRVSERRLSLAKKFGFITGTVLFVSALLIGSILKYRQTSNPEVARLYNLARLHLDKATKEGKQQALESINQALKIDPNFAPGYATLLQIYFWDGLVPNQDNKIRECARNLLRIDKTLAESHTAVSWVKFMDDDWQAAETEIKVAIKRDPNYGLAHYMYGFYLALLGRVEESHMHFARAQELDPASRDLAATAVYPFLAARQYAQAIEQVRKALALDPNYAAAHQVIANIYEDWGKYPEAISEFEKSEIMSGQDAANVLKKYQALRQAFAEGQARGYWLKKRDLMEILGEFVDRKDLPGERLYYLAKLYAHLGDKKQALEYLEKAQTEGHDMLFLKVEPCWDTVSENRRFQTLLKEAGLVK